MIQRWKVYAACAVVVACSMIDAVAGEFSRVVYDVSALPQAQRFVADLLASRIEARTSPSDAAQTLTVRFAVDATVPGENAVVTVKGNGATVAASRFRGLVQGAGVLLRRIRYGGKTFSLEDGEFAFAPKKEVRMAYFARHFHNWYHHATADELREYIDDLVLAGHNAFHFQYAYPTFDRAGKDEAEIKRFIEVSKRRMPAFVSLTVDSGWAVEAIRPRRILRKNCVASRTPTPSAVTRDSTCALRNPAAWISFLNTASGCWTRW